MHFDLFSTEHFYIINRKAFYLELTYILTPLAFLGFELKLTHYK